MAAERVTHRAAVLGSPIGHSLSPRLHTAGYAAAGLTQWSYQAFEVTAPELAGFVDGLDPSWAGLSLTMPLKEAALEVAADVSDVARRCGAVNTLVRRPDGGWSGENTDVDGIVAALASVQHGGRARIIGAGATSRSAVLALARLGVTSCEVAARRPDAAAALADFAREQGLSASTADLHGWSRQPPPLVLSTVPVGAGPELAARLGTGADLSGVTLFDVVYAPWPSPLAAAVTAAGGRVVSGLEMLIHQAAAQFELFTGVPADLSALRAAVTRTP